MDVNISIVTYNTRDLLRRCLASIYACTRGVRFQVIVVDNNSKDGTVAMIKEEFPKVKLIVNKRNNFYSTANNQVIRNFKARYFLILNSDTYFIDNSIKKLVEFMDENTDVGAAEGLEIYTNGKIVPTGSKESTPLVDFYELSLLGKKLKNKKIITRFRMIKNNRKKDFEVDVACDAFVIVRGEILKKINGYNEALKLYYTENDICRRIKNVGYKIMHVGNAKIMHEVSVSTDKLKWRKLDLYYNDMLAYYKSNGHIFGGTMLYVLLTVEKYLLRVLRPNMFD